jgi:hypothetical protein
MMNKFRLTDVSKLTAHINGLRVNKPQLSQQDTARALEYVRPEAACYVLLAKYCDDPKALNRLLARLKNQTLDQGGLIAEKTAEAALGAFLEHEGELSDRATKLLSLLRSWERVGLAQLKLA